MVACFICMLGSMSVKSTVFLKPQDLLVGTDLRFLRPQPDISLCCKTIDMAHRGMCLYSLVLIAQMCLSTEGLTG